MILSLVTLFFFSKTLCIEFQPIIVLMVFRNLPLNLPDFTAAAMFPPCLKFDKNMHVIIANIEYKIRVQKIMWKNLLIFQSKITCENVHFTHVQKSQTPNYCYYLYSLKLLEKKF